MTGIFHDFNVFIQRPLLHFVWWGGPVLLATFELVCWYPQVDCILNGVHRNDVSVSDECNRTAYLCFRNDVANYESVRASQRQNGVKRLVRDVYSRLGEGCSPATEPSVCHAGYILAKTCTHNQTGGFEHFWHA